MCVAHLLNNGEVLSVTQQICISNHICWILHKKWTTIQYYLVKNGLNLAISSPMYILNGETIMKFSLQRYEALQILYRCPRSPNQTTFNISVLVWIIPFSMFSMSGIVLTWLLFIFIMLVFIFIDSVFIFCILYFIFFYSFNVQIYYQSCLLMIDYNIYFGVCLFINPVIVIFAPFKISQDMPVVI